MTPEFIAGYPKTGITVVIVGAGFGGLSAAIECTMKGHNAIVLEKAAKWEQLGDIISISTYRPLSPLQFRIAPYFSLHPLRRLSRTPVRGSALTHA